VIDDRRPRPAVCAAPPGWGHAARLLAAAVPALAGNGYHAARVDDMLRIAGCSHGALHL
jgi:AcrR family transcriptional regulator